MHLATAFSFDLVHFNTVSICICLFLNEGLVWIMCIYLRVVQLYPVHPVLHPQMFGLMHIPPL